MKVINKKLDQDVLFGMRKDVLSRWPTGKDVDLEEAIEYQQRLPAEKNFVKKLAKGKKEGRLLTMPGIGKASLEETIVLLRQ